MGRSRIPVLIEPYWNVKSISGASHRKKYSGSILLIVFVIFSIIKSISPKILTVFLVAQITIVVSGSVRVMPKKIRTYLIHIGENTLPVYGIHWCLLFSPAFRVNGYHYIRNNGALGVRYSKPEIKVL